MSPVPSGWLEVPLAAILESAASGVWGADPTLGPITARVLRNGDITKDGRIVGAAMRSVTPRELDKARVSRGDVIMTTSGDIGKIALIHTEPADNLCASNFVRILRPYQAAIHPSYLARYLTTNHVRDVLERNSGGTTIRNLRSTFLAEITVPLPPMLEQDRIVAAIEEQFSRLDAGVAALRRVRENVRHMKSAWLRDSWDAAMAAAGGLSRVNDLLESPLANGRSVPDGPLDGFPVLRLTCVRDGMIDDTETKAGAWTAQQAKQYVVREGDFLVVRGNGSRHLVGRGGIVMRDRAVAYPDTLIRIRPHPNRITARFLGLLWNSSSVRKQLENSARTTAGIYKINQQSLGRIELPVPARDIQAKIVSDADRDLSRSHLLEAEIANALGRTNRLRSAILWAAFSGALVPPDPSDEPATVLLERIRAERARSNGHKATVDRKRQISRRKVSA